MLFPERMTRVTIVCLQKDLDVALDALSKFGLLHIEKSQGTEHKSYRRIIEEAEKTSSKLDSLMRQLKIKTSQIIFFKHKKTRKMTVPVEDWLALLENISEETEKIEREVNEAFKSLDEINVEIADLQGKLRILEILDRFNIKPTIIKGLKMTCVFLGVSSVRHLISLERAFSNFSVIYYFEEIGEKKAFIFTVTTKKNSKTIRNILKTYDVELFSSLEETGWEPSLALPTIKKRLRGLSKEKERIMKRIQMFSEKYRIRLLALREAAWNVENALKLREDAFKTERISQIVGYAPRISVNRLEGYLKKSLGNRFIIFSNNHASNEDPPTFLRNPRLIKPFELITKLYGLPNYDEVDPTPIMAVTFPLIFGLMFGDLGHGLILFLGGLILSLIIKSPREWRAFCEILTACGFGAVIAGFLFGEAFGKHLFTPLWFDPFEDVTTFLVFSLMIGVLQITMGFILNLLNFVIKGKYVDALTVSLPRILFYCSAVYFLMRFRLNFDLWLSGPIFYLGFALVFLFFGKPIAALILGKNNFPHILGERIFEGSELLLSLLSNTMSYTRILALLMTHWALLTATYAISSHVSTLPMVGGILELVMIIGGNIFVIAFEGLIVFIHTLRLHFHEWFSKFYEGSGTDFQPFKYQQRFTKFILKYKRD